MERVISFVVNMWPTCKPIIIGKADVQDLYTISEKIKAIEELIEIIDRTINIERFNKTIIEFIEQVKCITVSIKDIELKLIHKMCSEVMLLLHGAQVDASKFMRCNMNRDSYDAEYHKKQGSEEFKVIVHPILINMAKEEEKKEKIMNKMNDQQGGDSSKDADQNDKIICDQQSQAIVVDHQNEDKLNVVMSNHNNHNDKINCDQQNKLNVVDNICENKSVFNVVDENHNKYIGATNNCHENKINVVMINHNNQNDKINGDQQNKLNFVDNVCENKSVLNIVDKNHNKDTEEINHCHENELNFVHEIHHNHVDKINNNQQIKFGNDICINDDNNNHSNVVKKKKYFKVVNNNHDNYIEKINVGQQYKIDCAKNKHKNKIKLKLINDKIKYDDKIKCKIKLKCLHLLNNNNEHSNNFKDGDKFGKKKKYCVHWDMCDMYVLDCRLSDGDGKSSWLLSFASCQGPGGMPAIVFMYELQWRIQDMPYKNAQGQIMCDECYYYNMLEIFKEWRKFIKIL